MNGTPSTAVATRNGTVATAAKSTAVAIRASQVEFDDKQRAALVAMGVSDKVTRAELAVFFHQCRNLRLDPFSKQIYLIHRKQKEGDRYVLKPTTQIGIDGFRVTRDRICEERGLSVSYEDTIWYDADRQPTDVWLDDEPPSACKFVVLIDDGKRVRRFPATLRFNEYCQRTRDGERAGRWKDGHSHQIEKCAEADALRKAFPNDLSGVILEDAAPLDDPDAPATLPQDRPRVTAEDMRQRGAQQRPASTLRRGRVDQETGEVVDATIIDEGGWPDGAQPAATVQPPAGQQGGGYQDRRDDVIRLFTALGYETSGTQLAMIGRLTGRQFTTIEAITADQANWLAGRLAECTSRDELEAAAVRLETSRADDASEDPRDE